MVKKGEDSASGPGGHAGERLREFLRERLHPGASPDELNPELARTKKDKDRGLEEKEAGQIDNADRDSDKAADI
jgi:hypothetical protein